MSGTESRARGSLTIVGTGIRASLQTTPEARMAIERAEKVLFLLDAVGARWIETMNRSAESLDQFYSIDRPRRDSYRMMVDAMMSWVRNGVEVCVAFYGHPGVFVVPSHGAIRLAREEGYEARMIPGVSAEDCLIADLGLDPGDRGLHSYEVTDFLLYGRAADPSVHLILWQIGALGEMRARRGARPVALRILATCLEEQYGPDHEVVLYQASPYPFIGPMIERVCLSDLPHAEIIPMSTLYVPPRVEVAADEAMFDRLAIQAR